jgi:biopolymer transport protein ExbD
MRRFSDRHQLHTLSELNVTPLLDLAFVLLIIFMITTPLMENSTDVVLPSGDAAPQPANMDKVQRVSLHADGHLSLNETTVTLAALEQQLTALRANEPELGVLIRPHKEQQIQALSELLDAVKRAGVKRVGFVSTPRETP